MKPTNRSPHRVTAARLTSRRHAACRVSHRAQWRRGKPRLYGEKAWGVEALARSAKAFVSEQEMLGANHRPVSREDQRAFDDVLQFANVPSPGLRLEQLQRCGGEFRRGQGRGKF